MFPSIRTLIKCALLLVVLGQSAWAQLSVSPKRVIFEDRERSHELLLINTGDKTKKYRIGFKQLKMTRAGGYQPVTKGEREQAMFASDAVRFSPRQVTLAPGMSQTVRLLVRKPKGLIDGEYRSHLTFSEIPDDTDQFGVAQQQDSQGFAFRMRPLLGISIPIILRQGKLIQAVDLKPVDVANNRINLELHRKGQVSVYGEIIVSHKPLDQGPAKVVGIIKGVSVLPPLDWRTVSVPLTENLNSLGKGELHISYNNLEVNSATKLPVLSKTVLKL